MAANCHRATLHLNIHVISAGVTLENSIKVGQGQAGKYFKNTFCDIQPLPIRLGLKQHGE